MENSAEHNANLSARGDNGDDDDDVSATCTLKSSSDVNLRDLVEVPSRADLAVLTDDLDRTTPWLPIWTSTGFYESRLKSLLTYQGTANTYSLACVPGSATWGDGSLSSMLCANNRPVKILVVGELQTIAAAVDLSSEVASTRIRVDLVRDLDRECMGALLQRSRGIEAHVPYFFEAARTDRHTVKLFNNIFDATDAILLPHLQRRVSFNNLRVGDLVLLETVLVRDDQTGAGSNISWWKFTCKFALASVALLARSPDCNVS